MIVFIIALLALLPIGDAGWTAPEILMRTGEGIVFDACIDSNNNTLLLFQKDSIDSKDLLVLTYISDGSYIDNIRQVMRNQGVARGYPRNRMLCRQNTNNDAMIFSVTKPAEGAGILAEATGYNNFVEKYKREGIKAGSLLFINSTERTVLFMANATTLWFVTRAAGSEVFSNEQIFYTNNSFNISDITSAASKRHREFLWHVAARVGHEIYYFLTENNGVKWEEPYLLENIDAEDYTVYQISFIANYDLSSTIFLAYMDVGSSKLYLTWTSNNGDTWARPTSADLNSHYFFTPYGFLYTIDGKPALFLSDARTNYAIAKSWTENRIELAKSQAPVYFAVYTTQTSSPSLLQGFGRNNNDGWIVSSNQTDGSSTEEMER